MGRLYSGPARGIPSSERPRIVAIAGMCAERNIFRRNWQVPLGRDSVTGQYAIFFLLLDCSRLRSGVRLLPAKAGTPTRRRRRNTARAGDKTGLPLFGRPVSFNKPDYLGPAPAGGVELGSRGGWGNPPPGPAPGPPGRPPGGKPPPGGGKAPGGRGPGIPAPGGPNPPGG